MPKSSLMEAAYNLATAVDRAADNAVHEEIARIVKLHAKIAVASAWIPVPVADLAALATNTWTMYVRINKVVGIPFAENVLKSLATGIGTNLVSNLPIVAVGGVLKAFPGVGTFFGGLVMSASMYGVTMMGGIVYMKALTMLLNQSSELSEVNFKKAVDSILKDKESIKNMAVEIKKEYDAAKAAGELDNDDLSNNVLEEERENTKKTAQVGNIESVTIDFDVNQNESLGMTIHTKFCVYNLKGAQCQAIATFHSKNGTALVDSNHKYCTNDGSVAVSEVFTPKYDNTSFSDFMMFMPYSELHIVDKGIYELMFWVKLYEKSSNTQIACSERQDFKYIVKEI